MKVLITKPSIADVQYLEVIIPMRDVYPEDWIYNGDDNFLIDEMPFYSENADAFIFFIDLSNGYVLDWEDGDTLDVCAKVRDEGEYWLVDKYLTHVIQSKDKYVPQMLDTRHDGGGDYIQFKVNDKGYIENWKVDFDKFDVKWVN